MKIRSVGAELLYTDRQTDRQKETDVKELEVAFLSFSKAPNKPNINYMSISLPYLLENY